MEAPGRGPQGPCLAKGPGRVWPVKHFMPRGPPIGRGREKTLHQPTHREFQKEKGQSVTKGRGGLYLASGSVPGFPCFFCQPALHHCFQSF